MLLRYLFWHYGRGLRGVLRIAGNFLAFAFHLFSVRELADSFFAPWKRITFSRAGAPFTSEAFEAFVGNIISRVLGAIARATLIVMGAAFAAMVLIGDVLLLVVWLVGPSLPPLLIFFGVTILS